MKNTSSKYKKYKLAAIFFGLIILFVSFSAGAQAQESKENKVHLDVFYGQGCLHCASLLSFLDSMENYYPTLIIDKYEIYQDNNNRELFEKLVEKFNAEIEGVPTTFINDKIIVGFSKEISVLLENEIKKCLSEKCPNPIEKKSKDVGGTANELSANISGITNKLFAGSGAKENIKKLTAPIVIGAAAVDAINPCAFAVLIILMTAALSISDKKRALKFGLAFTISIYISYFLMGLGLFSALQATGISRGFYIFVTALAIIVGLLNLKDYFWYGKGFLMEVPLSWRPAMKKIINNATSPLGAFLVGFIVSLFELPCTGGPYIVILGLLAKEATKTIGIMYLLLYNLIFVTPLIILSIIIYKGLSTTEKLEKIRQEKIKILHLIAGILMLVIAGIMVLSIIKGWI